MSALAAARRARASSTDEGTRLNAFGEPFRGRKIRGVGAVERARGRAFSSLSGSQRESFGNQQAFGAELEAQALNLEAQQAAARGRARALAEMEPQAAPSADMAPAAPEPATGGGWFGQAAKAGNDALMVAARRERAKRGMADRAKARARYESEQRGARPDTYAPFQFAA